ncbi:MAG: YggS family pyridoxal phosphate-dependent enzyme [Saprospiraceae bacterium]|nr:YggS family pyridoxal phosphate-dependent enzyme [Saprospiraceae bacterium]
MYPEIKKYTEEFNVTLVAVSKTKSVADILTLYDRGQRIFGENKVQELDEKYQQLPKDIHWHLIGHLQKNKVKYIASFVSMIQSADSLELLLVINKEAEKHQRIIPVLLQFHITRETSKFGLDLDKAKDLIDHLQNSPLKNILICGVMGMASLSDEQELIRIEFKRLKEIYDTLKNEYFRNDETFREISMGMSGDYKLAIAEGSTMVRIGSAVFGGR